MRYLPLLFVTLFMIGCAKQGQKLVPVSGTLTQKGVPMAGCSIEFRKTDSGALSFAETDATGHFTLMHTLGGKGAEPGRYIVSIWQKGKPLPLPAGVKPEDIPEEQRHQTEPDVLITNSDKSPIEVAIVKGTTDLTIALK